MSEKAASASGSGMLSARPRLSGSGFDSGCACPTGAAGAVSISSCSTGSTGAPSEAGSDRSRSGSGAARVCGFVASSSAMIRRMEARISSIDGSWAFAGCVMRASSPPRELRGRRFGWSESLAHDHPLRFGSSMARDRSNASNGLWTRLRANGAFWSGTSAAVRDANAVPGIAYLLIMHHRVVDVGRQAQHLRRQPAHGGKQVIGGDHAVMLRGHQRDAGVHQRLLGVEDVERGALADAGLLANAVERHFRGSDLGLRGGNLRLGRLELAPCLHHGLPGLVADQIEIEL